MRGNTIDKHAGRRWALAGALAALLLAGCATGPSALPHDPLEPLNRSVQRFNDSVDEAVLQPVASAYRDHLPRPVRTGVGNFFGNLRDLWSSVNAVLQLRPREAAENFMRFNVNTFFGLGGVLDVATEMGIERTTLDVGHTLGRWGVPAGPYLVLPLLGPSSVRDSAGLWADRQGDWVTQGVDDVATRNSLVGLRVVDTRASLLGASALLEQAALDRYSFVRDAYLQRRQSQIDAGRPPADEASD
jgi:phospholipid-binding lipoprotein MlaA